MNTSTRPYAPRRQHGAAAVEFALIAMIFFTLLFGALELARMMYVYNSLQEITRRAAREMTVRWISDEATAKTLALFGGSSLPGGAEITSSNIVIEYLAADGTAVSTFPSDPSDNLSACGDATRTASCIFSVRVSINTVNYSPMLSLFSYLNITMPSSSVTMHAESMGFES
jgi:Flp pilus assembly protein TadG